VSVTEAASGSNEETTFKEAKEKKLGKERKKQR
jgi:hypothetical protein